jgi:two-component system, NtrC family, sensor kinase
MRRRSRARSVKPRRRKGAAPKRPSGTARLHTSFAASPESEAARLTSELSATSEILRLISNSPGDLETILRSVAEQAAHICQAQFVDIFLVENDDLHDVAWFGDLKRTLTIPLNRLSVAGRSVCDRQPISIDDLQNAGDEFARGREIARKDGHRSILAVPLIQEGRALGTIVIRRTEIQPFEKKHTTLLTNFAAQAVIAIENARLLNEQREALDQQRAIDEILRVIANSPSDVQPVLNSVAKHAARICEARFADVYLLEGDTLRNAAWFGKLARSPTIPLDRSNVTGRSIYDLKPVHVIDLQNAGDEFSAGREYARQLGHRTTLAVPLIKEGCALGTILVRRTEVRPFEEKHIALLTTFADQAAIAIENVRLFNAEQQRTKELSESLAQQTATADVLKVISRSTFDLQAVLETLTESGARLCEADMAAMTRQDGKTYYYAATYGYPPELNNYFKNVPHEPGRGSVIGRTILLGKTIHVPDVLADTEYTMVEMAQKAGIRTALGVPLLREGKPIGVILLGRNTIQPFSDKQIELITSFADQAVIAIENVRLFEAEQQRTKELSESLAQQTATADVLKVISRSAFDLRPVLDTLVASAARLCDADRALIFKGDGAVYRVAAGYNTPREFEEYSRENPIVPGRGTITGRAVLEGKTVHIPDVLADPEYEGTGYQTRGEYRSSLAVPLLREGETIGVFTLMRLAVRPYTEKQIDLVTTFADQAVIAIENVRLFEEVQARTSELAQSVKELQALGEVTQSVNSSVDLETVLTTIVAKATQLSSTEAGAIYVFEEDHQEFRLRATYGMDERIIAEIKDRHMHIGETAIGKAAEQRMPVQIADLQNDPSAPVLDVIARAGFRALLVVRRKKPGEFLKSTVDLLQTFAAQSVLAIQNARLFENVETRTHELAKSLEDLRTAQDRLVQTEKLASLGQLTAGIAHEIKNPLNFVNNFSAVSVELIDELRQALAEADLDDKLGAQISEIADMLQGNLDKVVQHGKRADSIVKNMLLHSRQGSAEHRCVDINAIVEESLNLAYHGARAEKQGFNITLERSLDPTAGEADVYPQDITRVLLNLISNGFYAATKRIAEANGGDFEPILSAATKSLGNSVEIRIRDNGTGIPPEVKEKIFNPFFTTKPAGEGTGLGLSISHDVIVKQHGGSIEVDTKPGEFTEFRIILPRGAATIAKSGERP